MSDKENLYIILGIFLISVSTLVFEISMIRIFSISLWYHLAYMIISIALFGYGVSGTLLTIFPNILKSDLDRTLVQYSGFYTVTIIISYLLTNYIPLDPFQIIWSHIQIFYLLLYYIILSIPFLFSGLIIGLSISRMTQNVSLYYSASFIGSAFGALIAVGLSTILNGQDVVISTIIIGAIATILFSIKNRYLLKKVFIGIAILLLFTAIFYPIFEIRISPYKSLNQLLRYPNSKIISTEWNSISRVDVIESSGIRYAPGLSLKYTEKLPGQLGVIVDADNLNAVTEYNDNDIMDFLNYLPIQVTYVLNKNPSVLILGSNSLTTLLAIKNNSTHIDIVEKNPLLIDTIKSYKEFSGNIYNRHNVNVLVEDERNYIHKTEKKYDSIVLLVTENVISSTTGILGQSENYVYTKEAVSDYFDHLSENGTISITRWLYYPPKEEIRLFVLVFETLKNDGIRNPENHIVMFRTLTTYTLLVKKTEFSSEDISKIRKFLDDRGFDIIWASGITEGETNKHNRFPEPVHYRIIKNIIDSEDRDEYYYDYLFNIAPVTDDNPYFFNFFKFNKFKELYESMGKKWEPFLEGGFIVFIVFLQAVILSVLLILLPITKIKAKSKGRFKILLYFFLIGIGYMFVEITLIQKFILFLGQPIYSISIVLSSLLFFSGIGSLVSKRLENSLKAILLTLSFLIIFYQFLLPSLFSLFIGKTFLAKTLISILAIAPLGFLMGIPFPIGIQIANRIDSKLVPWAWSVNGCSSVLSSVLAVIIAMNFGFKSVFILAGFGYFVALLTVDFTRRLYP